jgi:hypothetical protein
MVLFFCFLTVLCTHQTALIQSAALQPLTPPLEHLCGCCVRAATRTSCARLPSRPSTTPRRCSCARPAASWLPQVRAQMPVVCLCLAGNSRQTPLTRHHCKHSKMQCRQVPVPCGQLLAVPAHRHSLQLGRAAHLRRRRRLLRRARVRVCGAAAEAPAARAVPILRERPCVNYGLSGCVHTTSVNLLPNGTCLLDRTPTPAVPPGLSSRCELLPPQWCPGLYSGSQVGQSRSTWPICATYAL